MNGGCRAVHRRTLSECGPNLSPCPEKRRIPPPLAVVRSSSCGDSVQEGVEALFHPGDARGQIERLVQQRARGDLLAAHVERAGQIRADVLADGVAVAPGLARPARADQRYAAAGA